MRLVAIALFWLAAVVLYGQAPATTYEQAVQLVQKGQFDRAIPVIQGLVVANPRDLRANNLLGIALAAAGRKTEAAQAFRAVLALDGDFVPALKNLAVSELAAGKYAEAGKLLERAVQLAPKDPMVHYGLAEVAYAGRRHADAVSHFEASGDLYLRDPAATLKYARSAVEIHKSEAAVSALSRLNPAAEPRTHFEAGVLLAKLEKYEAAALAFRAAQPKYPDAYEVGYNLTLAYFKANDFKHAIETGETLARNYRKTELFNLLSSAYDAGGRVKEAYEALRTATEIDPAHEPSYIDLITLCIKHQNHDLALEISGISLKALPDSSRLHLQRGVVMAVMSNYEEAEREFQRAADLAPSQPLAFVCVALARLQMNKLEEATALLRERRKASPGDYLTAWFLGDALGRQGVEPGTPEEKEAFGALEDAVKADPRASAPRTLIGKLLLKRGQTDAAAEAFETALKLDPEDMTAAYQLALLSRRKGDTKRAEELFAKVSKSKAEDRDQAASTLVKIVREGSR